ncbi:protein [Lichtheimia corymbifera JMRC:FSU:9682]|uniref:Protein n=1 Tax=Lichtheimia corymbifera JMRC:FSU:9682 TaxID=1263082 RepID=A0A068RP59_9FUNG|nr:protein [Lichtheimia corymbifera JMRC:FSU:9682]
MDSIAATDLDAHSWVALAIFLFALVFVIRPVHVRINKHISLHFNLATAPPLGLVVLLASQTIHWQTIADGFLGTNVGVEPYAIMLLFYSLLDRLTFAFRLIQLDSSNIVLFGGLASNDVVVLTGTAFLSYFTRVSDIQPTAFLMSEFTSANIASMAIYIGNPTNVVVSEAFNINFVTYSAWMLLPTFICLGIAYIALRVVFHNPKYVPRVIYPPDAEPKSVLIDPKGAVFGLVLLGTCLATLIGTSFVHGVSVWMVTLPFAIIMLLRDIWYDLYGSKHQVKELKRPQPMTAPQRADTGDQSTVIELGVLSLQDQDEGDDLGTPIRNRNTTASTTPTTQPSPPAADSVIDTATTNTTDHEATMKNSNEDKDDDDGDAKDMLKRTPRWSRFFWRHVPGVSSVIARMPWTILPFALSMFVLVEGLSEVGWIAIFAKGLHVVTIHYVATVFGVMGISILACQLLNNLPMTILFTRILQHPSFNQGEQLPEVVVQAAVLGLVVGSNLGACLTLVGSLAGIMFEHILKTKGIFTLGYFQFLKWNLILLPIIAAAAASVVIGELWFIYLR